MAARERAAYDAGVRDSQVSVRAQVEAARAQEREAATVEFEARMSEIAAQQEAEFTRVVEPHLEAAFVRGFEEGRGYVAEDVVELGEPTEPAADEPATPPYVSPVHWYTPGKPVPSIDANVDRWAHLRDENGMVPAHIALGQERKGDARGQ